MNLPNGTIIEYNDDDSIKSSAEMINGVVNGLLALYSSSSEIAVKNFFINGSRVSSKKYKEQSKLNPSWKQYDDSVYARVSKNVRKQWLDGEIKKIAYVLENSIIQKLDQDGSGSNPDMNKTSAQ